MINFRRKQEKTPFQWNLINHYMQYQQGKKHYWGVNGKDYGLYQSPPRKRSNHHEGTIQTLKNQHLAYEHYQPRSNINSPKRIQQHRYSEADQKYRMVTQPNSYQKPHNGKNEQNWQYQQRIHLQTEPIANLISSSSQPRGKKELKRNNLSLQSKNVEVISDIRAPIVKKQPSPSLHHQFSLEVVPERLRSNTFNHQKTRNQMNNQTQMDNYRERIVRVVKKDRKNNPTYCNSLLYPLHCYRYIE